MTIQHYVATALMHVNPSNARITVHVVLVEPLCKDIFSQDTMHDPSYIESVYNNP